MQLSFSYHPQVNVLVKQVHCTVMKMIWATLLKDPRVVWCEFLSAIQLIIILSVHTAYKYFPHQVLPG